MSIDSGADHSGLTAVPVHVTSDGLLLYVSHASYEEGISPLSCWIPIRPVTIPGNQETGNTEQESNGPLDLFQRYVHAIPASPVSNSQLVVDSFIAVYRGCNRAPTCSLRTWSCKTT